LFRAPWFRGMEREREREREREVVLDALPVKNTVQGDSSRRQNNI